MTDERFAILVVCHANICRSPMAERLARKAIADRLGAYAAAVEVSSAGIHARPGRPMHLNTMRVLREYGADDTSFRSRQTTGDLIARADLILTANRRQRAGCVTVDPVAVRRTFTLLQFGRLAAAMSRDRLAGILPPQARLRALVNELHIVRGGLPVAPLQNDDLADPVNEPIESFRRCAKEIHQVVDVMMDLIAPI